MYLYNEFMSLRLLFAITEQTDVAIMIYSRAGR